MREVLTNVREAASTEPQGISIAPYKLFETGKDDSGCRLLPCSLWLEAILQAYPLQLEAWCFLPLAFSCFSPTFAHFKSCRNMISAYKTGFYLCRLQYKACDSSF